MGEFYENKTLLDKLLLGGFVFYMVMVLIGMMAGIGPACSLVEWCRGLQENAGLDSGKVTLAIAALAGLIPFAILKALGRVVLPAQNSSAPTP